MTFDDYQTSATETVNPALTSDERLLDAAAGLAEEAAEVLGAVRKHRFQDRPLDLAALREELGDALWCIAATATATGMTLDEIAQANIDKIARRWPERTDRSVERSTQSGA
jgi:NTP pyrophosphatase (non-canonical NTP hydrolase)